MRLRGSRERAYGTIERGQRTGGLSSRDCADGCLSPSWMARREQLTSLATKVNLNAQLRRLADAFQR